MKKETVEELGSVLAEMEEYGSPSFEEYIEVLAKLRDAKSAMAAVDLVRVAVEQEERIGIPKSKDQRRALHRCKQKTQGALETLREVVREEEECRRSKATRR